MAYELTLTSYQGPLDKLLELIEEKKLEISEISLAEVTADFLDYLEKLTASKKASLAPSERENYCVEPSLITDFLVIASKLILIKSKTLLPSLELDEEEEIDIKNLESRLKIYAEFKNAQKLIKERWNPSPQMAFREFLMVSSASFYPPKKVFPEHLLGAVLKILGELEKIFKPVKAIRIEVINLKKKIEEVFNKLREKPLSLSSLGERSNRSEIVVLFLAILHLIKEQLVRVEQAQNFGEIVVARREKSE